MNNRLLGSALAATMAVTGQNPTFAEGSEIASDDVAPIRDLQAAHWDADQPGVVFREGDPYHQIIQTQTAAGRTVALAGVCPTPGYIASSNASYAARPGARNTWVDGDVTFKPADGRFVITKQIPPGTPIGTRFAIPVRCSRNRMKILLTAGVEVGADSGPVMTPIALPPPSSVPLDLTPPPPVAPPPPARSTTGTNTGWHFGMLPRVIGEVPVSSAHSVPTQLTFGLSGQLSADYLGASSANAWQVVGDYTWGNGVTEPINGVDGNVRNIERDRHCAFVGAGWIPRIASWARFRLQTLLGACGRGEQNTVPGRAFVPSQVGVAGKIGAGIEMGGKNVGAVIGSDFLFDDGQPTVAAQPNVGIQGRF